MTTRYRVNATVASSATSIENGRSTGSRRRRRPVGRRGRWQASVEIIDDQQHTVSFDHFEMSATELYLHSDFLLCPGDEVHLKLELSTCDRPLRVLGKVTRSETGEDGLRPGMAVALKKMTDRDRNELRLFLMRRLGDYV